VAAAPRANFLTLTLDPAVDRLLPMASAGWGGRLRPRPASPERWQRRAGRQPTPGTWHRPWADAQSTPIED